MRSITFFGAFLAATSALSGCDSAKPPVSTPPPVVTVPTPPSTPPTAEPATSGSATPPTGQPSAGESRWVGSWSSGSCGERKYERRITLNSDKTFSALDLVSPCPPKVTCVWAGIIGWSGTWALNDKGAVLTKTTGGSDPTKKSNTDGPLQLVWDKGASAPAEQDRAGASCVYASFREGAAKP